MNQTSNPPSLLSVLLCIRIFLSINVKSRRAFALTCTKLITLYKDFNNEYLEKPNYTFLYDQNYYLCDNFYNLNLTYVETVKRNWDRNLDPKYIPFKIHYIDNVMGYREDPCVSGYCYFKMADSKLPENLKYAAINHFSLELARKYFSDQVYNTYSPSSISILEKFTNLASLRLIGAIPDDIDQFLTTKNRSWRSLTLNFCRIGDFLPQIIETFTPEKLNLLYCDYTRDKPLKLNPECTQLITRTSSNHEQKIDLSACSQIKKVEISSSPNLKNIEITFPAVHFLRNMTLECPVNPLWFMLHPLPTSLRKLSLRWDDIYNYRTLLSDTSGVGNTRCRNLHFERVKCLKQLRIIHIFPNYTLNCKFPPGTGSINIILVEYPTGLFTKEKEKEKVALLTFELRKESFEESIHIESVIFK